MHEKKIIKRDSLLCYQGSLVEHDLTSQALLQPQVRRHGTRGGKSVVDFNLPKQHKTAKKEEQYAMRRGKNCLACWLNTAFSVFPHSTSSTMCITRRSIRNCFSPSLFLLSKEWQPKKQTCWTIFIAVYCSTPTDLLTKDLFQKFHFNADIWPLSCIENEICLHFHANV